MYLFRMPRNFSFPWKKKRRRQEPHPKLAGISGLEVRKCGPVFGQPLCGCVTLDEATLRLVLNFFVCEFQRLDEARGVRTIFSHGAVFFPKEPYGDPHLNASKWSCLASPEPLITSEDL